MANNKDMFCILIVSFFLLFAGCIAALPGGSAPSAPATGDTGTATWAAVQPGNTPQAGITATSEVQPTDAVQKHNEEAPPQENYSETAEVNYREYVDWFMAYNLHIRAYTPDEYVCGQYTVDMINASKKAGFKAYFGAIRFTDGTGHALVAFKSTHFGYTSWYFFEPQTNNQMNPETIKEVLQDKMGKTVNEVTVYGYFDDAGDKDPATWRFAYPLYNRKY